MGVALQFLTLPLELLAFNLEIGLQRLESLDLVSNLGSPPARTLVRWCGLGAPVAGALALGVAQNSPYIASLLVRPKMLGPILYTPGPGQTKGACLVALI